MNEQNNQNNLRPRKTKKWLALGSVAAAIAILMSSTYLWFTAEDKVENVFGMDGFDVTITEEFDPGAPVTPGAEIKKDIGVKNNSAEKVAVRIKLEESLQLLEVDSATQNPKISYNPTTAIDPASGQIAVTISKAQVADKKASGFKANPALAPDTSGLKHTDKDEPKGVKEELVLLERKYEKTDGTGTVTEYLAYVTRSDAAEGPYRLANYDPKTQAVTYAYYAQGAKVACIHKHGSTHCGNRPFIDHNKIKLVFASDVDTNWKQNGDWYYYTSLLGNTDKSGSLTKEVHFAKDLPNEYKGAVYTLTPVMQAVQGKQEAVDAEWGGGRNFKGTFEITDEEAGTVIVK